MLNLKGSSYLNPFWWTLPVQSTLIVQKTELISYERAAEKPALSTNPHLQVKATLYIGHKSVLCLALINSRADDRFIDEMFVTQAIIPP